MRFFPVLAALTLAVGCASQPSAPPPEPEPVTKLAATEKPEAKTLDEAQKLGYKIVNENGQTLYCRETMKLGSHLRKDRTCLTEQELAAVRDSNQRNFENMKKAIPPPHGT